MLSQIGTCRHHSATLGLSTFGDWAFPPGIFLVTHSGKAFSVTAAADTRNSLPQRITSACTLLVFKVHPKIYLCALSLPITMTLYNAFLQ